MSLTRRKPQQGSQREAHMIDGVDRGGKPHRDPERVADIIAEYDGDQMPDLGDHTLKPLELRVFEMFCDGKEVTEIAEAVGLSERTIKYWKKKPWWTEMRRQFIDDRTQGLYQRIAARAEEIEAGYFRVINGTDKQDKTANAVIQGVKVFAEMGPDPLINRKPNVLITHNTQNNILNADPDKFRAMSQSELFEFARTGKRPQELE